MSSDHCKMMVKQELEKLGLRYVVLELGMAKLDKEITAVQHIQLKESLLLAGLELQDSKKSELIEKIQAVIIEMVHHSDELPLLNTSDYISERLNYDYTYLANVFSEVKGMSIQQFIIQHKIERVKKLLSYEQLSLTKIADKLHYSSVAHLSNQFKKVTGLTPSSYKRCPAT